MQVCTSELQLGNHLKTSSHRALLLRCKTGNQTSSAVVRLVSVSTFTPQSIIGNWLYLGPISKEFKDGPQKAKKSA